MSDVFTPEEVHSLNEYQNSDVMHPFTCGGGHRTEHPDGEGILVATTQGWVCPYCDYRQDWAHDFMKNGAWKKTETYQLMQLLRARARIFADLDEEMVRALRDLSSAFLSETRATDNQRTALLRAGAVLQRLHQHGLLADGEGKFLAASARAEEADEYDWKPIAPDALPGFDDLLLQDMNPPYGAWCVSNKHFTGPVSYQGWMRRGWRWFSKLRMPTEHRAQRAENREQQEPTPPEENDDPKPKES